MAALRNLGFSVQPFIVGPGIKPACAYNEATGNVAVNLDSSLHQGATELLRAFWQGVQRSSADIAVVDGGVGLFDGSESEEGARSSAAEVAKILGTPCVLVMDGRHQRTAVALLDGLLKFDPDFDVLGVVFNKLAPGAQLEKLASQLREHSRPLVTLGGIPMTESLRGGVVGYYGKGLEGLVGVAEGLVREHVDVSRLLQLLRGMPGPAGATDVPPRPLLGGSRRARVALAQDELFEGCFPENLALMQEAGAEVVTFSPLHDTQLPAGVGLVYLGSMSSLQQHPHLPLSLLSKNQEMCCELRAFAKAGGAVLSEGSSVALVGAAAAVSSGADSREYATLGIMPWTARLEPGRATMAYCQLLVDSSGCPAFAKGTVIGGVAAPAAQLELAADADVRYCCRRQAGEGAAAARDGAYMPGLAVLATWAQLHFGSCPSAAEQVVSAAAAVDALEVRRRAQRILTAQRVGGATGGGTAAPRRSAHGGCVQRGNAAVPQTRWSADSHVELGARADRMSMPATGGLLAGSFSAPEFGRARPARLDQPFSLRDSWDGAGSSRGSSASGSSSPERRLPQRVLSLQQPPPPPPQQQQQQQGVGRGGWEQLPPLYMHHLSSILPTCSISNQLALLNHHTRPQHPQQEAMRPRILSEDRAPLQPRAGPLRAWDSQPTAAALHARTAAGEAAALRSRESARSLSGDCGNPVVASAPEAAAQAPWGPPRWQASAFSGPHEVHLPPPLRAAAPPTLLERSASLPAADGPLVPPPASSPLWRRWSFAVHTAGGAAGGGTLWGSAVACLSPAAADIMQQLGLGHLLAAVPATAAHVPTSAKHLPAVLFQREALDDASTERARGAARQQGLLSELPCLMEEVDAAEVAQLQPQLLVLQHAAGWRSQRLVQQVKEASSRARREEMQVLDLGAKTLAGVLDGVLALGAAVGAAAAAQQLVDRTQRQLRQLAADAAAAAAAQRRGGGARSTRMLVLTSIAEELVLGGHWVPELTALAGGQDSMQVAGDRSRALSWKELTVLAPEVLVLSHAGGRQAEVFDQLRELMKLPGFWSVPAVYRSEVYIMDPAILARPGPQLVHGAAALARILGTAGARKLPAGHLQRLNLHPGQRCRPERLESHFTPVV